MILNLVDSTIPALPPAPTSGMVNVKWHVGSMLSTSLPPNIGAGSLQLMRLIAPHRDIASLCDDLNRSFSLLRRYFAPRAGIEIYGANTSSAAAGSLPHDGVVTGLNLPTVSGSPTVTVGAGFAFNTSGQPITPGSAGRGINIGGRVFNVAGNPGITVGKNSTTVVGGAPSITVGKDATTTVGGSEGITVGKGSTTVVGGNPGITVGKNSTTTVGGSLPPDLLRAVRGARCLFVQL
jgi:hypothetical protein